MAKIRYFKYRLFNLFIPVFFSIASIVMSSIALAGSSVANKTNSGIYLIKLDLLNINYSSILVPDNEYLHEKSRLRRYYTAGLYTYCRTNYKEYDFSYFYCIKERNPATTFNLYEVLENEMFIPYYKDRFDYYSLPAGITVASFYTKIIFAFFVIGIAVLSLTFLLYLFYAVIGSHQPQIYIPCLSLFSGICFAISGSIAYSQYSIVIKAFKRQYDKYGIDASFGTKIFYSLKGYNCISSIDILDGDYSQFVTQEG